VAAIMVGLVMVGLGLATASPSLAPRYWLWLVPVFGLLSVLTAWIGSPDNPRLGLRAVSRQLLHWLVIGGAVALDFWLRGTGRKPAWRRASTPCCCSPSAASASLRWRRGTSAWPAHRTPDRTVSGSFDTS